MLEPTPNVAEKNHSCCGLRMFISEGDNFPFLIQMYFYESLTRFMFASQCLMVPDDELQQREVDFVDIAFDELPAKYYKEEEVGLINQAKSAWDFQPYICSSQDIF